MSEDLDRETKEYPLTFEEFEETVLGLLFSEHGKEYIEILKERLDVLEKKEPDYMLGLYHNSCFIFDNPHLYGDNCKKEFEREFLRNSAVRLLKESLGLGMIPWDDLQ